MRELISEQQAWSTARALASEIAVRVGDMLKAVCVIGSLAGGGYRPGRSDIDTVAIVCDDGLRETDARIQALAGEFRKRTGVSKEIGVVVVAESKLRPPYNPKEELVPEILRLRHQGIVVYGEYDLNSIPDPTPADFVAYAKVFYPWLRAIIDERPQEYRNLEATVNTLLYEIRLWLWDAMGDYVFDKRQVISAFLGRARSLPFSAELSRLEEYLLSDESPITLDQAEQLLQSVSHYVRRAVPWSLTQ